MVLGDVVEKHIFGLDKHPYHQHTHPFQLVHNLYNVSAYFKAGDWHDTWVDANYKE